MRQLGKLILDELRRYDSFLESLKTICDVGCGTGEDTLWWANLTSRDDLPETYNYQVLAVDKNPQFLDAIPNKINIIKLNADFTKPYALGSIAIDLLWAHDVLQYSTNPLETLKNWNQQMSVNGMLALTVPMHTAVVYNTYQSRAHSGCYFSFTPANLIYMLAVNGFDCNDAYLLKRHNDPWIYIAVYKSEIPPMDPAHTTLIDLIDTGLLNPTVVACIEKYGYIKQEEILYPWLDRENYFIDYVSQATDIGVEIPEATESGIKNFSNKVESDLPSYQAKKVVKEMKKPKPVGILRPPKHSYK